MGKKGGGGGKERDLELADTTQEGGIESKLLLDSIAINVIAEPEGSAHLHTPTQVRL